MISTKRNHREPSDTIKKGPTRKSESVLIFFYSK